MILFFYQMIEKEKTMKNETIITDPDYFSYNEKAEEIGKRLRGSFLWMLIGIMFSGISGYALYYLIEAGNSYAVGTYEIFFYSINFSACDWAFIFSADVCTACIHIKNIFYFVCHTFRDNICTNSSEIYSRFHPYSIYINSSYFFRHGIIWQHNEKGYDKSRRNINYRTFNGNCCRLYKHLVP